MEIMGWSNFTYTLRQEGWKWAIRIAVRGWIVSPWQDIRIKVGEVVLSLLRVTGYFE